MTSEPSNPKPDHLPALDGLRGIAVLLVLWFHVPQSTLPELSGTLVRVLRPGYFGVDFFFVLSGFLITRILLDYRRRGVPLKTFFVRRFLRIFPAYYLLIAVIAVVDPTWELAWAAVYLSNFYLPFHSGEPGPLHHVWSLSVEEHFYLFWPFVVACLPLGWAYWTMRSLIPVIALLSALLIVLVWDPPVSSALVWQNTGPRSLSLAAGGALAIGEWAMRRRATRHLFMALAALVGGAATLVAGKELLPGDGWLVVRLIGGTVVSTAVVAITILLRPDRWPSRLMSLGALTYVGKLSYGLYLYHHPIFYYVLYSSDEPPTPLGSAAAVALSFVAAVASYYAWELPFLRLKDAWASPRVGQEAAPAPPTGPGGDGVRSGRS